MSSTRCRMMASLLALAFHAAVAAEQQTNDLSRDQERLRQNINSLRQVTGQQEQVQEYARQLAANEIKLAGLRDQSFELRKKKSALESELNSMIEKMEF